MTVVRSVASASSSAAGGSAPAARAACLGRRRVAKVVAAAAARRARRAVVRPRRPDARLAAGGGGDAGGGGGDGGGAERRVVLGGAPGLVRRASCGFGVSIVKSSAVRSDDSTTMSRSFLPPGGPLGASFGCEGETGATAELGGGVRGGGASVSIGERGGVYTDAGSASPPISALADGAAADGLSGERDFGASAVGECGGVFGSRFSTSASTSSSSAAGDGFGFGEGDLDVVVVDGGVGVVGGGGAEAGERRGGERLQRGPTSVRREEAADGGAARGGVDGLEEEETRVLGRRARAPTVSASVSRRTRAAPADGDGGERRVGPGAARRGAARGARAGHEVRRTVDESVLEAALRRAEGVGERAEEGVAEEVLAAAAVAIVGEEERSRRLEQADARDLGAHLAPARLERRREELSALQLHERTAAAAAAGR